MAPHGGTVQAFRRRRGQGRSGQSRGRQHADGLRRTPMSSTPMPASAAASFRCSSRRWITGCKFCRPTDRAVPRDQACAPHMVKKGKGSIVLTASVAGLRANAGGAPYSASKAGVREPRAGRRRPRSTVPACAVNAICPGLNRDRNDQADLRRRQGAWHGQQDRPAQSAPARRRPRGNSGHGACSRQRRVAYVNGQAFPGGWRALQARFPSPGRSV